MRKGFEHNMLNKNNIKIPHWQIGIIVLLMFLVDRFYWAQISQWREDQATNIWLGYTAEIGNIPVGLMSSGDIPNPNGMILLGIVLSRLPNLLSISFVLGSAQLILIALVGWKAFGRNWHYFLMATIPIFSSVILRSTSVEFWNQYTLTLVNLFFLFWALRYLENQSLWNIPPITILILMAPSMYVAGVVNALTMTMVTIGMLVYRKPKSGNIPIVLGVTGLVILISILLTWLPFIQNADLDQITDYNKNPLTLATVLTIPLKSFLGLPFYTAAQWVDGSVMVEASKNADPRILSSPAQLLISLIGGIYLLQAIFAITTSTYLVITHVLIKRKPVGELGLTANSSVARIVILSALFICFNYTFSSWLGGPSWWLGERPDQTVQFLPMFLLLIFLVPLLFITKEGMAKSMVRLSLGSMIVFSLLNMVCGWLIIRDHLQYRGRALTEADVPLIQKMQVIKFISDDWRQTSDSNIIPVDYKLGGGKWDWVPEYGNVLVKWYPAPMTEGRGFDYELLHQYGLTNYQEGKQIRTFGTGRYLITYAFENPPQTTTQNMHHYIFGRLRVSVVDQ